ncbi:hypothetical protein HOU95_gp086 [Streptomyces phage Hiyaa]|uniref:Uncharacterized protein n=1 Tax=Streptomyces phage Hiyaa TaxID=2499072 RepID=A0A3S9U8R9_9CAUD|nr:hypothetical protein HOU95_gp086 [Streptomyces phage Hiyaa]AZS06721.1 hypothetical protein SEA_HIYAA_82 [Streptomyces phage Hiyaa]
MAFDSIKAGLKVITRIGGKAGAIHSITRHPVTRSVLAVIIAPEGVIDPNDFIVTSARNLRTA